MRKRTLFVVLLAAALVVTGVLTQFGFGRSEKARIANASVASLARTARSGDTLPPSVLAYPFADRNFANPRGAGSRLLTTQESLSLYAVPGKDGLLCLITVDSVAETAGGSCAERSALRTGSIFTADKQEDGSLLVAGLAGDGVTYAEANGRRAHVQNNAFVLRHVEGDAFTVGSPAASQTLELGD
jgi:hypothetical protein